MFSPLFIHIKLEEKTYKTLVLYLFKPLYVRPNMEIYASTKFIIIFVIVIIIITLL